MSPSQRPWRVPIWVPLALIAGSVIIIICCVMHLSKRAKSKWPW